MIRRIFGLALVLAGCGGGATSAGLAATTDTVTLASNMSSVPELAGLMTGVMGPRIPDGIEGFRCDSTPTIETTTVCGKTFPSSIALDWTSCAGLPDRGGPPGAAGGNSSGTVSITNTISSDSCDDTATWTFDRQTSLDITRTRPDGSSHEIVATVSSTSTRQPSAHTFSQQRTYDVRRTEGSGTTHTTGQLAETFDGTNMTMNGTLHEDRKDGTSADITATDVVRGDPRGCRWPTAGTIVETLSDGSSHTLVFGGVCGQATFDGAAVTLPEGRGHHGGDHHMGPGGCMGPGMHPDGGTPDAIAR